MRGDLRTPSTAGVITELGLVEGTELAWLLVVGRAREGFPLDHSNDCHCIGERERERERASKIHVTKNVM